MKEKDLSCFGLVFTAGSVFGRFKTPNKLNNIAADWIHGYLVSEEQ